jgi:hypothetical protein
MDTYSHVIPEMQQGASDKLEQMFSPKLAQMKLKFWAGTL